VCGLALGWGGIYILLYKGREGSLRYVEWGPIIRTILKFERKLAIILLEKQRERKMGKGCIPFPGLSAALYNTMIN
jgi:hypothetical protein